MGNLFPGNATEEAAVRLLTALQSRPGHVLVTGADIADVDAVFERVDARIPCHRRLRIAGDGLDAETVIRTLGADLASAEPPPATLTILTSLVTDARAAGAPIVVIVSKAEDAGTDALEHLCAFIDLVPDARDVVRLVLLGGPRLTRMLAEPEARNLWNRFLTIVQAPLCERAMLSGTPADAEVVVADRRWPRWGTGLATAAALGTVALLSGSVRHWGAPPESTVANTPPAAVTNEPPVAVQAEPPVATSPTPAAAPETSPDATAGARVRPPAVAVTPPPVAVTPPPVAVTPPPPAVAPATVVAPPAPVVAAPPAMAEAPTPASIHGEALQLGAFRSADNAQALRDQVARLYPDAQVSDVTVKGVPFHCVRLGAANARDLAARAAALRAAGFPTVRVRD